MTAFRRITLVVLDSVGIGAAPDAERFGDTGSDTVGHIHAQVGLTLPNLVRLGFGRLTALGGDPEHGAFGRLVEVSDGKDTMTGHFELAGVPIERAYPTYPDGFPDEVIDAFSDRVGCGVLANKPASGTAVIDEFGAEHMATGKPIVYTSADSVFQIAAHEDVISVPELYAMCEAARALLVGDHHVARVIARPFVGTGPGQFTRTGSRKDYAVTPPGPTMLDRVAGSGREVVAVGKIGDIFSERGITVSWHAKGNPACIDATLDAMRRPGEGLVFSNLVDFDMLYGHRNDPAGYRDCLQAFDARLPELLAACGPDQLLLITADHGNDPCFPGTDHTREVVPLLAYHPGLAPPVDLGTRTGFADVAASVVANFGLEPLEAGVPFLDLLTSADGSA